VVFPDASGPSAVVEQSDLFAAEGIYSARTSTSSSSDKAQIRINFSDPASAHQWNERPGTWHWQQASVYLPSSSIDQLGPGEYFTIAGMWPSNGGPFGWFLRVHQNGSLYAFGYTIGGNPVEFNIYGSFPLDQWVELELGLHSQNGPGVKRAFAFLINGSFYGWYHQGNMVDETYDRIAFGILDTNSNENLEVFIDQWHVLTDNNFPGGPDFRSTDILQEQDFRNQSGIQWQIDWNTWEWDLHLHPLYGIYSNISRLQSGRNLDRMPDITSGWAEIEIDWPNGTPPLNPSSFFGPMVAFRKEVNREENLEFVPIGAGNGNVDLVMEAWVNGGPVVYAQWPLPTASIGGTHIPEPGDIIRARWEQINSSDLNMRVSFYDASTATWHNDVINITENITNIGGVDFQDGFHTMSSITIDSIYYSIRRFQVGTLTTYP
jgi:hypothetical protein